MKVLFRDEDNWRQKQRRKSASEANLLFHDVRSNNDRELLRNGAFVNNAMSDEEDEDEDDDEEEVEMTMTKATSRASLASRHSKGAYLQPNNVSYRMHVNDEDVGAMLNDKYFNMAAADGDGGFKYPHLQLRNVSFDTRAKQGRRILDSISFEARGGELVAIMATKRKYSLKYC